MSTRNKRDKQVIDYRSTTPKVAIAAPPALSKSLSTWLLLAVLMVMALRLTWSEQLYDSISGRMQVASEAGKLLPPTPKLATVIACGVIMMLLSAAVAWTEKLSRAHLLWLAAIVVLGACAAAAQIGAPSKLLALAGTCDLLTALLSGWSVFVLIQHARLRPLVLAVIFAVFTAWTFRVYAQRIVELPDTIEYFKEHRAEIFAQHGWKEGDKEARLFEGRFKSREVGGFQGLSNVFAAGEAGMLILLLVMTIQTFRAGRSEASLMPAKRQGEVPLPILVGSLLAIIFLGGVIVFTFSESKGASIACTLVGLITLAGVAKPALVLKYRRKLIGATCAAIVLGVCAVVTYGLVTHGLPSRSLLFRWHYWTGTVPMIREHPLLGVGLNNFGNYYTQFKLPFSPEDPKDPHNFFIRIAAEIGLPAMLVMLALVGWAFWRTTRERFETREDERSSPWECLGLGAAFCVVLFTIHPIISDRMDVPYNLIMNVIHAVLAMLGFALVIGVFQVVPRAFTRVIFMASAAGAAAILLYDQVNMAAVTGPVAMLFWVMLAVAQPEDAPIQSRLSIGRWLAPVLAIPATVLFFLASVPLAQGNHPWDFGPLELQMMAAWQSRDLAAAEALADQALSVESLAGDVMHKRIQIRWLRHEPIAADVREMIARSPNDSRLLNDLAMMVGTNESDWPVAERIAVLEKALELDRNFAWLDKPEIRDPTRFTDEQVTEIRALIAALKNPPATATQNATRPSAQ